jgi:O-acetyl-ADP-ribose deacetylase (regulator of RNase III)
MIVYKEGSIFDSTTGCLVNPVNCVGVMGKGLALDFKRRYPEMFKKYKEFCDKRELSPGRVAFWASTEGSGPFVCLFPTKFHFREKSTLNSIDRGFQAFIEFAPTVHIKSAAFPKVGCGLGGLNFERHVRPLFEKYFRNSALQIEVYV